jgi:hypothetical protein
MANWVLFAAGVRDAVVPDDTRLTRYTIESCRAVVGPAPAIGPGLAGAMLRVESGEPVKLPGIDAGLQFRGTAQHLNYTGAGQRVDLEARSRGPIEEPGTVCVMIPIAKSAAWWQLPVEERTASFQRGAEHHQHVAIGAPYVERIYRKLYHSRYCGGPESPIPYDFVTYFEFPEAETGAFQELLAGLRDPKRNPEWAYVTNEFEVWMRRTLTV